MASANAGRWELTLFEETTEIARGIPPEMNGRIRFMGSNLRGVGLTDIFSFTYYLLPDKNFIGSVYHIGLRAYVKMIQRPEFANIGMVVYTDPFTLPHLLREFPLELNPNLVFAIVDWPYYHDERGITEGTVMRTMRYQAVDHFPEKNVHMRDADTLFIAFMKEADFNEKVIQWEAAYLKKFLPRIVKNGYQIVIGTSDNYGSFYHRNLMYPVEFSFPYRKYNQFSRNPEKFLILGREENREALETYKGLTNQEKSTRKNLLPKANKTVPFSRYFQSKFMFDPKNGVYAGFTSVLKDRTGIENFWERCVNYLLQRYYMIEDRRTGKRIPTNALIQGFTNENIGLDTVGIYTIGKDERMLLYAIIPDFLPRIFFFKVYYSRGFEEKYFPLHFYKKEYFNKYFETWRSKNNNTEKGGEKQRNFYRTFESHSDNYKKWLTGMLEKYPTEADFLNAMNQDVQEHLIPYNIMKDIEKNEIESGSNFSWYPSYKIGNNFLRPYTEYEKAGRATRRRKNRRGVHGAAAGDPGLPAAAAPEPANRKAKKY